MSIKSAFIYASIVIISVTLAILSLQYVHAPLDAKFLAAGFIVCGVATCFLYANRSENADDAEVPLAISSVSFMMFAFILASLSDDPYSYGYCAIILFMGAGGVFFVLDIKRVKRREKRAALEADLETYAILIEE